MGLRLAGMPHNPGVNAALDVLVTAAARKAEPALAR
jgi:hypothetical protein